eukprot:12463241-Ditylum_brightwellii.AAC.1
MTKEEDKGAKSIKVPTFDEENSFVSRHMGWFVGSPKAFQAPRTQIYQIKKLLRSLVVILQQRPKGKQCDPMQWQCGISLWHLLLRA